MDVFRPSRFRKTFLLPDAKTGEYLVQDVRRGGLARDAADQLGGGPERTSRELPGFRLNAVACGVEVIRGLFEQRGVSFRDDGVAGLRSGRQAVPGGFFQTTEKMLDTVAGPGGDMLENRLFCGCIIRVCFFLKIRPVEFVQGHRRAVHFVPARDELAAHGGFCLVHSLELSGEGFRRSGGVQQPQHDVGGPQRLLRTLHAHRLDRIGFSGLAKPGGVGHAERNAADGNGFLQRVARGAGDGRDDRAVVAEHPVEKAGFSGVWRSRDDQGNAVADERARARCEREIRRLFPQSADLFAQNVRRHPVEVLLGEIEAGFAFGEQMHDLGADVAHQRPDRAVELAFCEKPGAFAARVDEIEDALGLRQVELAVEKRPPRELAVLREPCARLKHQPQRAPRRETPAVTVDLCHVLARETVRTRHEDRERRFPLPCHGPGHDMTVQHHARMLRSGHASAVPHRTDSVERVRPGNADDADRAAGAGADGRDRVVLMLEQGGNLQKNEKKRGAGLDFPAFW